MAHPVSIVELPNVAAAPLATTMALPDSSSWPSPSTLPVPVRRRRTLVRLSVVRLVTDRDWGTVRVVSAELLAPEVPQAWMGEGRQVDKAHLWSRVKKYY